MAKTAKLILHDSLETHREPLEVDFSDAIDETTADIKLFSVMYPYTINSKLTSCEMLLLLHLTQFNNNKVDVRAYRMSIATTCRGNRQYIVR